MPRLPGIYKPNLYRGCPQRWFYALAAKASAVPVASCALPVASCPRTQLHGGRAVITRLKWPLTPTANCAHGVVKHAHHGLRPPPLLLPQAPLTCLAPATRACSATLARPTKRYGPRCARAGSGGTACRADPLSCQLFDQQDAKAECGPTSSFATRRSAQAVRAAIAPCFSVSSLKRVRGQCWDDAERLVYPLWGTVTCGGRAPAPQCSRSPLPRPPIQPLTSLVRFACSFASEHSSPWARALSLLRIGPQTFPWLQRLCQLAVAELAAEGPRGPVDVSDLAARLTSDTIGDVLLR
jgi:hypothetical protein